jgi:hypothetical protein
VNITTNINLGDPTAHQFIYASQLYQTFFAVSATMTIEDNDKKEPCLKRMRLSLINFKGHLNLGLLEGTKSSWYCNPNTKGAMLTLHLQPTKGEHGPIAGKYMDVDCKMTPLSHLKYFIVNRNLKRYSDKTGLEMLTEGVFDNEFYKRDGLRCIKASTFKGEQTKKIIDDEIKLAQAFEPNADFKEEDFFDTHGDSFQALLSPVVCETTRAKFING